MNQIIIILFRECLEISILLGIILVATKNVKGSRISALIGTVLGSLMALAFAFTAYNLKGLFYFLQEDIVEASIILFTSLFIIWTVAWIGNYSSDIKNELSSLSLKILDNNTKKNGNGMNYFLLILTIAFIVFREGSEIFLFVYGIKMSQEIHLSKNILAVILGCLGGVSLGLAIYYGLLKFSVRYIFRFSSFFLVLISAGLASESASILTSSGLINILNQELWNTSWFIDNSTTFGKAFSIMTGYSARPNGMQILFYLSSVLISLVAITTRRKLSKKRLLKKSLNITGV